MPLSDREKWLGRAVVILSWASAAVLVLTLTAVLYAVASGFGRAQPPRTAVERQLQFSEATLKADKRNAEAWQDYINALNLAGRYTDASDAYSDAVRSIPASESVAPAHISYARVLVSQKRYEDALRETTEALSEAKQFKGRLQEKLKEEGVTSSSVSFIRAGDGPVVDALVLKAELQTRSGDWRGVVVSTTDALERVPIGADILTMRGRAYLKLGQTQEARADFAKAVSFNYEPARVELERLEK